ncbi:hypothetical protein B0H16DRAFT_1690831 [Mycena metata]|uniref:MYND-type domain-containing protein n=1 Tax=Mycena metata TaxID=1033252 RepID=A0AAD7IZU4_9AGAR|nr:hypothetical protein B0H16DRAFT_1690831 [Mycena metata]
MSVVLIPTIPHAQKAPAEWNSDWELFLLRPEFAPPHGPAACFTEYLTRIKMTPGLEAATFDGLRGHRDHLCGLQALETEDCLDYFHSRGFEVDWMGATPATRAKHVLIGLAEACSIAANLNQARAYCAHELRLSYLSDTGDVVLELLKSVLADDNSFVPATPKYISTPSWDAFEVMQNNSNPTEMERIALDTILVFRTMLICFVLLYTMRSFLGEALPKVPVLKGATKTRRSEFLTNLAKATLKQTLGTNGAKMQRHEINEGIQQRRALAVRHCASLACCKPEVADGVKFSRCRSCMDNLKREIFYCSRSCQKADWKHRHKDICGKTLNYAESTKIVPHPTELKNASGRIGPPVNGYKRPFPLVRQVTMLNEAPSIDYYLANSQNRDVDLKMADSITPIFRATRETACTTGNIEVIAAFTHFLCWSVNVQGLNTKYGLSPAGVVTQLAREFNIEVGRLRELVRRLQHVQDQHPNRIPPLLLSLDGAAWAQLSAGIVADETAVRFD